MWKDAFSKWNHIREAKKIILTSLKARRNRHRAGRGKDRGTSGKAHSLLLELVTKVKD